MAGIPNDWAAATTYAVGDLANLNGVVYRALNAVTGNAMNEDPSLDTTNWSFDFMIRAEDRNGIIEAVKLELNVDDDQINNSIPYYIQLAEQSFYTRVRPSADLVSIILTTQNITVPGYEGRIYIPVPADLLNVENMRINDESGVFYGLLSMGRLEIKASQSDYDFEIVRQLYQDNDSVYGARTLTNYNSPVYRFTTIGGISYFELAPSAYMINQSVELRYYRAEPKLGTRHPRINSNGEPVNSMGQNRMQFEADSTIARTPATASFTAPATNSRPGDMLTLTINIVRDGAVMRSETGTFPIDTATTPAVILAAAATDINGNNGGIEEFVTCSTSGNTFIASANNNVLGGDYIVNIFINQYFGGIPAPTVTRVAGTPMFMQQIVQINRNWFTAQAPHMIIYGALAKAAHYLKDENRAAKYEALFKAAEAETIDLIYRFEEVRPTEVQMYNPYSH